MTTATAIQHADVNGRILFYLKLEKKGLEPVMVNIGEKTYNKVKALNETTQLELPIEAEWQPGQHQETPVKESPEKPIQNKPKK